MGLSLRGTTSGAVDINAPAVAGDNTITLPGTNGAANQFYKNSGTAGIVTYSSMVEDSSGNVGIGTDNPTTELQVNHATNECTISLFNAGTKKAALQAQNSFGTILYSYDDEPIIFSVASGTSYSEKLRITSDGYARLTTANARLEWTASSGSNPFIRSIGSGQQELEFNTGSNERLRITSAGKIQVTGTRGGSLQASDNDSLELYTASASSSVNRGSGITFYNHDGSGYEMGGTIQVAKENGTADNTSSYMRFATRSNGSDATERMRITSAGFVGINETSPDTQLHIKAAFSQNDANGHLKIENTQAVTNSGSNASLVIRSHNATSQFMNWQANGMRIGQRIIHNSSTGNLYFTAGNDTVRLTIDASNGNFTGSSSADISDGRLKENIQDIGASDAVTIIKGLQGRTFTWKEEAKMGTDTKYGFIAQEVETVIPNLVHQNMGINRVSTAATTQGYGQGEIIDDYSDAYRDDTQSEWSKSVEKTGIIPVLVEALKDALSKIETLETQNADLLTRVTALEG
jgi:hypothetical protein